MRWPVGWLGLVATVAGIMAGLACRQLIGITDNPPTDLTSTLCGLPYGTNTCASCVQASCCEESTACAGDVACAAYFGCLGECKIGDWQCRAQCQVDHSFAHASGLPALAACTVRNCETECGLTCGEIGVWNTQPSAAPSCHACFATNNCAGARACSSSPDCVSWVQCMSGCATPDCRLACPLPDAGASDAEAALFGGYASLSPRGPSLLSPPSVGAGCSQTDCPADWSCVGQVAWPGGVATTLVAHVQDWISSKPVVGADVKICAFFDPSCNSNLAEGQTDGSGNALIPVGVGLGTDAFAQITAPTIVPTLYSWGYPVSEPKANVANPWVQTFTPSELQTVVAASGKPWDMSLGFVGFDTLDCQGAQVAGVAVTIDVPGPEEVPFYLVSQAPSYTATETAAGGVGGISNVPPGIVNLTATVPALNNKVVSKGHLYARPGTISVLFMSPTP